MISISGKKIVDETHHYMANANDSIHKYDSGATTIGTVVERVEILTFSQKLQ